mmetsp:Transcript_30797/g.73075  ORF Transcript_30797/g.73075 Transcript_30797/m.73075 type:complete len:269 (+) Transcript_30797:1069-1875(+)
MRSSSCATCTAASSAAGPRSSRSASRRVMVAGGRFHSRPWSSRPNSSMKSLSPLTHTVKRPWPLALRTTACCQTTPAPLPACTSTRSASPGTGTCSASGSGGAHAQAVHFHRSPLVTASHGGKKHMRWQRAPQRQHVAQSRASASPHASQGCFVLRLPRPPCRASAAGERGFAAAALIPPGAPSPVLAAMAVGAEMSARVDDGEAESPLARCLRCSRAAARWATSSLSGASISLHSCAASRSTARQLSAPLVVAEGSSARRRARCSRR